MNELTIHGNVTAAPTLRYTATGTAVVNFSVAVNRSRFDRRSGGWVQLDPTFHRVVAFGQLAENAAETLSTGTLVTVTGYLADNSWQRGEETVRDVKFEAGEIAASLRFAKATLTRTSGRGAAPAEPATESVTESVTEPIGEQRPEAYDTSAQDVPAAEVPAEPAAGVPAADAPAEDAPAARAGVGRARGRRQPPVQAPEEAAVA